MGRMMMAGMPGVLDPDAVGQNLLRFQVAGDSMSPVYREGMVIECELLSTVQDEIDDNLHVGRDYLVVLDGRAFFRRLEKVDGETLFFRAINDRQFPSLISVKLIDMMAFAIARGEFIPLGEPDLNVPKKKAPKVCSDDSMRPSNRITGKTFAA